ncbi:hypothetical protein OH76DRAFT_1184443 [Lentinus brumalis]|uniref:Uncharacterized protein n=1 Tax=Lentinus brumalis TaxID=2498619 RepID=A0A371CU31_9APHY|nr:hypothetical protein OH76DRAFT_1184443 [Polyporus brumalis]
MQIRLTVESLNATTATSLPYFPPLAGRDTLWLRPHHIVTARLKLYLNLANLALDRPQRLRTRCTCHRSPPRPYSTTRCPRHVRVSDAARARALRRSFPPEIDFDPPCGSGMGTVYRHDVGEGREGQCRRRPMMRCGGGQCANVEDCNAGTAVVGRNASTPSENHRSTWRGCILTVAGTRTQKLDTRGGGIQHFPHMFTQRPPVSLCVFLRLLLSM